MSDERKGSLDLSPSMECPNCNGVLENPLQLCCGHHLCERCLWEVLGDRDELVCQAKLCGEKSRRHEIFPEVYTRQSQMQKKNAERKNKTNDCADKSVCEDIKAGKTVQLGNTTRGGSLSEKGVDELSFIRQDYKELRESWKDIRHRANDIKEHNGELKAHIENAQRKLASLEHRTDHLNLVLRDGIFIWKLQYYSLRRRYIDGCIDSSPFYSWIDGYKMCLRVYLNGDGLGQGTHLSLFFVIMKGEFDALLPWPFKPRVTLTLLDQDTKTCYRSKTIEPDPESSSFKMPVNEMNVASGVPDFISHDHLETPTYLQDDVIFLKIKIEITDSVSSFQGQAHDVEGEEEQGN